MINPKIILKETKGKKLYLQAGEATIINVSFPITSLRGMKKYYGTCFSFWTAHVKNNYLTNYIPLEDMHSLAHFFLEKQKKNRDFVDEIQKKWQASCAPLQKTVASLTPAKIAALSFSNALSLFQTIAEQGTEQWNPLIFIDAFDAEGEAMLEAEVQKHAPHLLSEIGVLTTPSEMSYSQQEKLSFLSIALHADKRIVLAAKTIQDLPVALQKQLHTHQQKFYWYKNNYAHIEYLESTYFFKELQHLLSSQIDIASQYEKIFSSFQERCKKRDQLLASVSHELQCICYFFQKLTHLRDIRKATHCMFITWIRLLSHTLAQHLHCAPHILYNMHYWETPRLLSEKDAFLEDLSSRNEVLYLTSDAHEFKVFTNNDAATLQKYLESKLASSHELKGMIASRGKATGVVKVINKVSEFSTFHKGDILVSAMTRPEFLPIMEKAAAIVTDEGGITSHAAIVSRELGIPCIIGTQTATRVLKNGQKVKVDANKGIIHIL